MTTIVRALAGLLAAALLAPVSGAIAAPVARGGLEPNLSHLALSYPAIHAVGVKGTHLPGATHLLFTMTADALVRIKLKDTNPYGLTRAFDVDLPAGDNVVRITAKVDGTKLPPGKYDVVVKAHNSYGSSDRFVLKLRIVGRKG